MSRASRLTSTAVALSLVASGVVVAVGATDEAGAQTPRHKSQGASCAAVTPATIQSTLNQTVGKPSVTKGAATVCTYKVQGGAGTVLVRFQPGVTKSAFTSAEKQFSSHGEPTTPVAGLGSAAYSSTIGSGTYTTNTIVVLKGSNQLLVTAEAPLSSVQALATAILPKM